MTETLVFISGKRTPFGANGGSLREITPTDLAVNAGRAALEQSRVDVKDIDHVIIGHVLYPAIDSIYTARHVGLKLGVPENVPALSVNRLCGTGFQVVIEAYHQMLAGDTRIALVGGVENMSMSPYVLQSARWGNKMGHVTIADTLTEALTDSFVKLPMAITAETLAEKYGISRTDCDNFALKSQQAYQDAFKRGYFEAEITPIPIKDKRGNVVDFKNDEHPKQDASADSLARLKTVFKKDGVITAGNASGIVDGASVLVVATENEAKKRGLSPLGRMISYGISGCDPKIMGIGPVPAAKEALRRVNMKIEQMDLIEVNEAFAPQTLAVQRELGIPMEKLNVNGGAIAVGHPLAASGSRILMHLLYELKRRKQRWGLGSACIGGGQGIAIIVEAL
ncbi:MAG: acetyl-CoA C-acyltransferase [Bdellovibrionota bacterium]